MSHIVLATAADVRRTLAACWRLYYQERFAELYEHRDERNLARMLYGAPAPTLGGPLDWHVAGQAYVWQTVKCPHARLVRAGAGWRLELTGRRGISRVAQWCERGAEIAIPSDADLAAIWQIDNRSRTCGGDPGRRARLLLGLRVDGDRIAVERGRYGFRPGDVVKVAQRERPAGRAEAFARVP